MSRYPRINLVVGKEIQLRIDGKQELLWDRSSYFKNFTDRDIAIIEFMIDAGIQHGKEVKAEELRKVLGLK